MGEDWVFLLEVFTEMEADIIVGMLEANGIPFRKEADSFTGAMRVIGGQAYEVRILVPAKMVEQARALLQKAGQD